MSALIRIFWQQKWLIVFITLFSLFIGTICIWKSTPVYEAKALIVAPTEGDIAGLNGFSIKSVYRVFVESLTSQSAQHLFNQAANNTQLIVKEERYLLLKGHQIPYSVLAKASSPAHATEAVTRYIKNANQRAMTNLLAILEAQNKVELDKLDQQIKMVQETAQQERDDQMTRLKEAFQIASALNLNTPSSDATALYMQGTQALSMEIQKLADRESNDAYTPGLRALQSQYASLKNARINVADVKLFQLDGTIEASTTPVAPRKQLIFILFLILGLSVGSLLAMLRELYSPNAICEGV